MKKLLSSTLLALFIATAIAGCTEIDPKRVGETGQAKVADKADQIDKLLAPPTGKDFYEDKNVLKMSEGKATVRHADGKEEKVTVELAVVPGDTVIIDAKGAGTLYWFDDSISRLKEGTELKIDKADFNPKQFTETGIHFKVVTGEVWSKVRALVDKKSEFLSYTGNVVSGVRGSTYNLRVTKDGVVVESIEHAAFLADVDPKTKALKNEKTIVRGQRANVAASVAKIVVEKMSPKDLEGDWMVANREEDKGSVVLLRQKNLERLRARAGALPGEPGYAEKTKAIADRLAAVTDPIAKATLEARVAALKANESLAVALGNPEAVDTKDFGSKLDSLRGVIDQSGLSEKDKGALMLQTQTELKAWDRAMEDVLPDQSDLFKAKEIIREGEVDLAPTKALKDEAIQKNLERQYFDLNDALDINGKLSPDLTKQLEQTRLELQKLPDGFFLENFKLFENVGATSDEITAAMDAAIKAAADWKSNPEFLMALKESGTTLAEYEAAMNEAIKAIPAMNEALKTNPYLNGQIPTIDAKTLQEMQNSINSMPTADQFVPPPAAVPTIDPALLQEIQADPTLDPATLKLLNTTIPQ